VNHYLYSQIIRKGLKKDLSVNIGTVTDVHLVHVYTEKLLKSSAVKDINATKSSTKKRTKKTKLQTSDVCHLLGYYLHRETEVCAVFAHVICGQVIASIQSSFTWYKTRRGVLFG